LFPDRGEGAANATPVLAKTPEQHRAAIRRAATRRRGRITEDKANLHAGTPSMAHDFVVVGSWAISDRDPWHCAPASRRVSPYRHSPHRQPAAGGRDTNRATGALMEVQGSRLIGRPCYVDGGRSPAHAGPFCGGARTMSREIRRVRWRIRPSGQRHPLDVIKCLALRHSSGGGCRAGGRHSALISRFEAVRIWAARPDSSRGGPMWMTVRVASASTCTGGVRSSRRSARTVS
jgi:hypothetical protein